VITLSCLIIYPRDHYIFVSGTLLLAVLAILSDPLKDRQGRWPMFVTALCAATGIITIGVIFGSLLGTVRRPQPNLEEIQFIKTLDITADVRLLSGKFGYTTYIAEDWGEPCSILGCGSWEAVLDSDKSAEDPNDPGKSVPFDSFRRNKKINMILVTDDLLNDSRFRNDAEWREFLANPENAGFVKLVLPDSKRALYVDKTILGSTRWVGPHR
jgi:hypothetical protein